MMIARWTIDVSFGHEERALALMRQWWRRIAPLVGWSQDRARIVTGSLGASESAVEVEVEIADLAELDGALSRLGRLGEQKEWAARLEPHVLSGTARWHVYRLIA